MVRARLLEATHINRDSFEGFKQLESLYRKRARIKLRREKPWIFHFFGIKNRCGNKNQPYYKKGIKNFLNKEDIKFLWFRDKAYLLDKPSIDRINPDGHYIFENCRFIEFRDNCKATRHGKLTNEHRKNISIGMKKYFKTILETKED